MSVDISLLTLQQTCTSSYTVRVKKKGNTATLPYPTLPYLLPLLPYPTATFAYLTVLLQTHTATLGYPTLPFRTLPLLLRALLPAARRTPAKC